MKTGEKLAEHLKSIGFYENVYGVWVRSIYGSTERAEIRGAANGQVFDILSGVSDSLAARSQGATPATPAVSDEKISDIEIGRRERRIGNRITHEFWCGADHGWLSSVDAGKISGMSGRVAAHRWGRGLKGEALIKKTNDNFNRESVIEINGVKKTMREWARIKSVTLSTLSNRYCRGLRGADLFEYRRTIRRTRIDESGKFSVNTGKNWGPVADVAKRAGVDEHEILRRAKSKCPSRAIGMEKMAYAELMALRDSRERKNNLPVGWGGVPKRHQPPRNLAPAWGGS